MNKKNMTIKKIFDSALQNHQKNNFQVAENLYREILKTNPNHLQSNFLLGTLSAQTKKFDTAKQLLNKATEIDPDYIDAHNNLGNVLRELGEYQKAMSCYQKAIQIRPNYANAHNNLGIVLQELEEYQKAISCYKKAIQIQPNFAGAHNNLGVVLKELGEYEKAINCHKKAIQIQPNYAEAYYNLGNILCVLGKYDDATATYHQAIKIKPDYAKAYSNLLFNLNYKIDFDPDLYISEAKNFRINCGPKKKLSFQYQYEKKPIKLRIGLVSADFGNHPGGYFTLNTLTELKKKNFEIIVYSSFDRKDEYFNYFRSLFSKWHLIEKKKDEEIVEQIFKDGIHILMDLQGHSLRNRLPIFMYKPAPIQATWLGQGSTGISEIDYFVGSPHITPKIEESHYVEKIWRLPEISQCFTPPNFKATIGTLPAIKNGYITFGCVNKLSKISDETIILWSRILESIPNSKLLLKYKDFDHQKIIENTFSRFVKHNVNKSRLVLQGESATRKELLEVYNEIDIALDPFPFQGNTTTIEAVWMGVPVITLKGDRYLFHFGESINSNLNMKNWVAKNHDEYVSKAIKFSSNLDELSKIRMNLRQIALQSPVFDAPRFADHFSKMLWKMWNNFISKN